MSSLLLEGFLLQAGLIWGVGAQNIFVVESGIRQQHHMVVAALSSLCDIVLIFIGVIFASYLLGQNQYLQAIMGVIALIFLVVYGVSKIIEGLGPVSEAVDIEARKLNLKTVVLLSLGFSLLNPHVYLDTVLFIGSYSTKIEDFNGRLLFASGASLFSILWFFGLSILSKRASKFLLRPKNMQLTSVFSGVLLIVLAMVLSAQVWEWVAKAFWS